MNLTMSALLQKFGINSPEELTLEEQKTYNAWSEVLNKPPMTIETLGIFLEKELAKLEDELGNYENSEKKDIYLKACVRNMKLITNIITSPEKERGQLREQLEQRFNNTN